MPRANVVVETDVTRSFRVEQVAGMFDVDFGDKMRHEWDVDLPIEDQPWSIGVIVGPSGSGKTTIGRSVFGGDAYAEPYEWAKRDSLLDGFPEDATGQDITKTLTSVGFSSPPSWAKPFGVLSNGEQFRVTMARLLFDERPLIVVDEFTSVVDRTVARIGSAAMAKSIRRSEGKQFVFLSCHYDILEWLAPDWILDLKGNEFQWAHLQRPEIKLDIYQVPKTYWELFSQHHYLNPSIGQSSKCYVAYWSEEPVAILVVMPSWGHRHSRRASRLVVLPDYQGIGLGHVFEEAVAQHYYDQGLTYRTTASHPAYVAAIARSPKWRITTVTRSAGRHSKRPPSGHVVVTSTGRATVGAVYRGNK